MAWIAGFILILAVVAVIGHGLWLLSAAVFRGISGNSAKSARAIRNRPFNRCPACRAEVELRDHECPFCGFELDSRTAYQLNRVRAAEAEVRALAESGDLDAETASTVSDRLERRARVLQGLRADGPRSVRPSVEERASIPRAHAVHSPATEPAPSVEPAPRVPESIPAAQEPPREPERRESVLAGFMEQRNILWGEVVGGLLIVGCSIALVVTLWNRLESIPYFPFLLSAAVTLALYGAGHYTLHHWKLESTSRGLLVIALLLIPLNLLLLSELVTRAEVADSLDVGVKLGAIALFAWFARGGGRDVLTPRPEWRWLVALAVVGTPATQLLPGSWFAGWRSALPVWLALVSFASALAMVMRRSSRDADVAEPFARDLGAVLLQFVGLAVYALAAAWGLYVARSAEGAERIHGLALPLALAAMPVVLAGLLVQRRIREGGLRATGTAVALAGFVLMTGALAAAWPVPLQVLLVSAVVGLFLTWTAFRESFPWAHTVAVPALALAAVVGYHGLAGHWAEPLVRQLGLPASGLVLVGFALALGVVAEILARRGLWTHAVSYALAGAATGLTGLFIASVNGPEYPVHAAIAHLVSAFGLIASNARWRLRVAAHGGLWLVLAATLWGMHAAVPGEYALWGFAVSVLALAFSGLALLLKGTHGAATSLLRRAGRDVAIAASALALIGMAVASYREYALNSPWHTGSLFVLCAVGLTLARLTGAPLATYLAAGASYLGVVHLAAFTFDGKPDYLPYLVGFLALGSLLTLAAIGVRRQERVFARPLRLSTQVISGTAALVLLMPPAVLALQWAGCAAWLGLIWLALALVWRERGAFSVFQVAMTAAAVLLGVAWVNAQDWRPEHSLGYFEPASLHVYGIAIGLLGLLWVAARRILKDAKLARELWTGRPLSAERVVLAVVVVAQLMLVSLAIVPEVKAELRPTDWGVYRAEPAALAQAFGPGAWLLLGVLTATVIASWRLTGGERDTDWHLVGIVLLFLSVPVIWAGAFAPDLASATALRWGLGLAFVLGTAAVVARRPLRAKLERAGFPVHPSASARPTLLALLAVAAGVVVLISAQVAEIGLSGHKPSGPDAGTTFAVMGAVVSNLVPLALVVLGLAGTAARERSSGYAFAGGLVFIATLGAGYALGVVTAGGKVDGPVQVRVWLLIFGGAAIWATAWLASERRVPGGPLLAVQSRMGLFGLALIAIVFALAVIARPYQPLQTAASEFGRFGWIALALAAGAAVWRSVRSEPRLRFHALALAATISGVLAAALMQQWDLEGRWLSFHVMSLSWAAVGIGLVLAARRRGESSLWLDGFAAAMAIMAIRGAWLDPWRPWLPASLALVASTLVGAAAVFHRSTTRVAVSGLLITLAAILLWLPSESQTASGFLLASAAGLAVAAAVWTLLALRDREAEWQVLTDLGRGIALLFLAFGLAPTLAGDRVDSAWLTWCAVVAILVSNATALWEPRALTARGGFYAAAVAVVLLGVAATTTRPVWDVALTPLALAAFALTASAVAVTMARATRPIFRLPERGDSGSWLLIAQGAVALAVVVLGVRIGLVSPNLPARFASPASVVMLALAFALLLRAIPKWESSLRLAIAGLGVLVLVTAAWAYPDPSGASPWLQRNGWLFVALSAAAIAGTDLGRRFGESWRPAARTVGGIAAALAVLVLCVNLLQQIPVYDKISRHTPLEPPIVLAMLAGILALIVLAIRVALRPTLDPLGLPESRRTAYVYLAEVLIVLFFTQIRFNLPELFLGQAVRYWTFAVMGLAFVGIGLAEFFERRRVYVLAIPLRRTGVLLPLIPLLAFWAKPPEFLTYFASGRAPGLSPLLAYLEKLPQHFDTYAWLWFLAGGVYGLVALSKKSFGWALLAALATNAALWSLLRHSNVPFFVHPQAWVIPLALIVLVSEHVNRRRLRPEVSNGMRYLGVAMIYIASAADMFIAGVGQSVWLPVILAVFCVAGVLAGIMMRVRAFIFLGVGFLLLDIFAMIWHAAVNLEQTWVWYVSGIVLGVAILALFAVFEKRKNKQAEG